MVLSLTIFGLFLLFLISQSIVGYYDYNNDQHDHPIPELHALLLALERVRGGTFKKPPAVPPGLMYYLVIYAMHAHHIHEDPEEWRRGSAHEVHRILQGSLLLDSGVVEFEDVVY